MSKTGSRRCIQIAVVVLVGVLLYAISGGIRANYGLIRSAVSENSGVDYASVSFILAVAQLSFGIMQPVFGVLALKKSNAFVLTCGCVVTAAGLGLIPLCHSTWTLMLCWGLLMPSGLGAFSFGIIMGAVTALLGERRAAIVSGAISASSGIGSIILAPVLRFFLDNIGLNGTIAALAGLTACVAPLVLLSFRTKQENAAAQSEPLRDTLSSALHSPSFCRLTAAFFTCGFHMAIIETHLYSQITSIGFSDLFAASLFSLYGLTTILGSIVSGILCGRFPMQNVLGAFYGSRCVWITAFLLLPKSGICVYLFFALLGFTGAATVPPTSNLISGLFGPVRLGTLFGLAFLSHQVGSFFSAWLGGVCLSLTGGYTLIWLADVVLSGIASVISLQVKERNGTSQ